MPSRHLLDKVWVDVGVPSWLFSSLTTKAWAWHCCRDRERELRGEADKDDEEWSGEDRVNEPGMFTGAEPPKIRWSTEEMRSTSLFKAFWLVHL